MVDENTELAEVLNRRSAKAEESAREAAAHAPQGEQEGRQEGGEGGGRGGPEGTEAGPEAGAAGDKLSDAELQLLVLADEVARARGSARGGAHKALGGGCRICFWTTTRSRGSGPRWRSCRPEGPPRQQTARCGAVVVVGGEGGRTQSRAAACGLCSRGGRLSLGLLLLLLPSCNHPCCCRSCCIDRRRATPAR